MARHLGAAKPGSRMFKRGTAINVLTGTKKAAEKPPEKPTKKAE